MQFKKVKVRVKTARGAGPDFILKQFEESYAEWEASVAEMNDEDKAQLEEKFNSVVDDLGSSLIDDKDSFLVAKAKKICHHSYDGLDSKGIYETHSVKRAYIKGAEVL